MENLLLALVTASKKLRHYFESHPISVITNFPLRYVLRKPELTGHLEKWSVYLSNYDVEYKPRIVIKSQVLTDFIVDFNSELEKEAQLEACNVAIEEDKPWIIHVDGSSNIRGSGLDIILKSPQGQDDILYLIRFQSHEQ